MRNWVANASIHWSGFVKPQDQDKDGVMDEYDLCKNIPEDRDRFEDADGCPCNVIAFVDYLPRQFKLEDYIDYNLQFEKTFLGAIEPVLTAVGWESEKKITLDSFFT